ncbi:MAG: DnaD domain protein, partial [Anaerovoracaceae bacterium]|nr:DnaD domain protein [Anaerovoracaceae bacterium]
VFTSMREQLYGIGKDAAGSINAESRDTGAPGPAADAADQKERSRLFTFIEKMTGKALGYRDIQEINSWLDDFGAAPETVKQAYRYCRERGTFNTRYVGTIVLDWTGRHLDTAEKVEKYLEENDMRRSALKRVMSYLGFSREPTEKERQLMDYWLDELNCSIDEILDACSKTSGISNPNFNYLDAVLRGKRGGGKNGAGLSRAQVFRYYEKMREEEENEAAARTEEVYGRVPEIREIDKKILELNSDLLTAAINGGADLEAGRERIAELDRKREALLTKNDIPVDYMKPRRRCAICGDTGQKEDGSLCSCFAAVAAEAAGASEA